MTNCFHIAHSIIALQTTGTQDYADGEYVSANIIKSALLTTDTEASAAEHSKYSRRRSSIGMINQSGAKRAKSASKKGKDSLEPWMDH